MPLLPLAAWGIPSIKGKPVCGIASPCVISWDFSPCGGDPSASPAGETVLLHPEVAISLSLHFTVSICSTPCIPRSSLCVFSVWDGKQLILASGLGCFMARSGFFFFWRFSLLLPLLQVAQEWSRPGWGQLCGRGMSRSCLALCLGVAVCRGRAGRPGSQQTRLHAVQRSSALGHPQGFCSRHLAVSIARSPVISISNVCV